MDKRILSGIGGGVAVFVIVMLMIMFTSPHRPRCGDNICSDAESCKSCPKDCGNCATRIEEAVCEDGLFWCEDKGECVRSRAHCLETPFGVHIAEEANKQWGGAFIYPERNISSTEGWWRASFNVPEGAQVLDECYIFMRGDSSREADGAYFLEHGPVNISGRKVCEIEVREGPVKPCGRFIVHIDLDAMKEGYDAEADNWRDFFDCETDGTDYCQRECDAMMMELMKQETSSVNITSHHST